MKRFWAMVCGLLALVSGVAAGQAPPTDQPWFSGPLVEFLDSPQPTVLGWSSQGRAALLIPVDEGGRGGPVVRLVLFDAVNDKILFDQTLWSDEFDLPYDDTGLLARDMAESDAGLSFIENCYDQGIQPVAFGAGRLSAFPLDTPGGQVAASVSVVPSGKTYDDGSSDLDYSVTVEVQGRGKKTVVSSRADHAWEVRVEGCFPSPAEPRVLVVYTVAVPGFEGERPRTYFFSGCHLKVGFTRP